MVTFFNLCIIQTQALDITGNPMNSLPPELWSQICQSPAFENVCSIRLSCRAMNIGICHYFAHVVLHEFYLTLTSEGLRALEYVAHHEIFSQYVKRLWIVPSLFRADYIPRHLMISSERSKCRSLLKNTSGNSTPWLVTFCDSMGGPDSMP